MLFFICLVSLGCPLETVCGFCCGAYKKIQVELSVWYWCFDWCEEHVQVRYRKYYVWRVCISHCWRLFSYKCLYKPVPLLAAVGLVLLSACVCERVFLCASWRSCFLLKLSFNWGNLANSYELYSSKWDTFKTNWNNLSNYRKRKYLRGKPLLCCAAALSNRAVKSSLIKISRSLVRIFVLRLLSYTS